jgi:hypothetical protein
MTNFCSKTIFLEKNSAYPGPNAVKFQKQMIEDELKTLSTPFSAISFTKTTINHHHYEHFETAGHLKMA